MSLLKFGESVIELRCTTEERLEETEPALADIISTRLSARIAPGWADNRAPGYDDHGQQTDEQK